MGKQGPCYHCGVTSEFLFLQFWFSFLPCSICKEGLKLDSNNIVYSIDVLQNYFTF